MVPAFSSGSIAVKRWIRKENKTMNIKPSIRFLTKDGTAPFSDKVRVILQKMTGNANFPSPTPALDVVQTAFDAYKVAAANAVKDSVQDTALRNARRTELV